MIVIENINELKKNKELIEQFSPTNYQQTYENIYSIHMSNSTAKTYINDEMFSTFINRDENIIECALNIEPIVGINKNVFSYIEQLSKFTKKIIYFPLVYGNSKFYRLLKNKIHTYSRLYTSLVDFKNYKDNIFSNIKNDKYSYFPDRKIKKIEKELYVKYYKNIDVKDIISEIEVKSWKYKVKQDMVSKKEQLIYYNELIKKGIAEIAVLYTKDNNDLVAFRIDALYDKKICVLKNSYKEEYKKYSVGTYLLIYDLYKKYKDYKQIDLYGGPGQSKKIIESKRIHRYDMIYGTGKEVDKLEFNRKQWDKKNYNIFLQGKSLKEIFNKKENVLVATSCFGLGPVGKLNTIIKAALNEYNWYAAGEEFDIGIFESNVFKDFCFSLEKDKIKSFVDKYNIKYAIVVLKNKMARLLKEIGIKVVYVDSLPFMWTKKDALEGKIPYNVDAYCAQKTLELNQESKKIFSKVENLIWIDPIANSKSGPNNIKHDDYILINLGGLHSPNTDGLDYIDAVIIPLINKMKNKDILITTSTQSMIMLKNYLKKYKNVVVKNLKQEHFLECIGKVKTLLTSPGLTTILESCGVRNDVIFLPPQNLSQFYNVEYGKKVFKKYKEINWNSDNLTLNKLSKIKDKNEHEIIETINREISIIKHDKNYSEYINNVIDGDYIINKCYAKVSGNGAQQVINELQKLIQGDKQL